MKYAQGPQAEAAGVPAVLETAGERNVRTLLITVMPSYADCVRADYCLQGSRLHSRREERRSGASVRYRRRVYRDEQGTKECMPLRNLQDVLYSQSVKHECIVSTPPSDICTMCLRAARARIGCFVREACE